MVYVIYLVPNLLHDAMKIHNIHKLPEVLPHFFTHCYFLSFLLEKKIRANQREQPSLTTKPLGSQLYIIKAKNKKTPISH